MLGTKTLFMAFCALSGAKGMDINMRNKKLIPFEVIEKAVAGEPEAVDAVLRHYTAYIKYLSMYKGHINDDTQDRLKAKLIEAILKFRFDR